MKKKKKLDPFFKDGAEKFTEEHLDNGKKKKSKIREQVRNANRKLKKSKRQQLKDELRKQVDKL